jgi:hypothetical protein
MVGALDACERRIACSLSEFEGALARQFELLDRELLG